MVFSEKKRIEKLRYMHRNPVKRGLVLEPQQWAWSSFRHYAEGLRGPVLVNEEQRAELRVRKISRYHQQEFPAVEKRDRWGSRSVAAQRF